MVKKHADEWQDLDRALKGYRELIQALRDSSSQEWNDLLDLIEQRVESGEDLDTVLEEVSQDNPEFESFMNKTVSDESSRDDNGGEDTADSSDNDGGFTKGQELTGIDADGNTVSGEYERSVFGRPQINTSSGSKVLVEVS